MVAIDRTDAELDELCRLLLGADRSRLLAALARIEQRGLFADWQSRTLADALRMALARDPVFAETMGTLISRGVHTTVQRDSAAFGKALAPAMGPAIRNAVTMMLQGLVHSIETVVDQRLSPKSLRWRWQAWRTGKSFAEIAFLQTLVFRVEHVFLVHKSGGVQLLHVAKSGVLTREPDLIAAMLTAIQDFVRDAFAAPSGDTLTSFAVGELTVIAETGSNAVLAAVVRGQPRPAIRLQVREQLDRLETAMAPLLVDFTGDVEPFEAARPLLEACLIESERPKGKPERKAPSRGRWLFACAALAVFGWLGWSWFTGWRTERAVQALLAAARLEPGYLVTELVAADAGYQLRGLRDPLARSFADLAEQHGAADLVQPALQPWQSPHAPFVLQRAERLLQPPASARLQLLGDTLVVSGSATAHWIERANWLAGTLAGIERVDTAGCKSD
jgi:OOP family OmpA-OmpF porin